jgi:PncC family amidohydrolase
LSAAPGTGTRRTRKDTPAFENGRHTAAMPDQLELEKEIGRLLVEESLTLAVAESCTGGLIGERITSVSGSSAWFVGGIIAYSNSTKEKELGVDNALILSDGAVSEKVAAKMAAGVRARLGSDIGLSTTGIAGPQGGSPEKPVGLVFTGLADAKHSTVRRHVFPGDRRTVRECAARAALEMLRDLLGRLKTEG